MGRLNNSATNISTVTQTLSVDTNLDIYTFIDEYGNVTQISKKNKEARLKYYADPNLAQINYISECLIGINNPLEGDCSYGIGLGIGDNQYASAIYE